MAILQPFEHQLKTADWLRIVQQRRATATEIMRPGLHRRTQDGARKDEWPEGHQSSSRFKGAAFPDKQELRLSGARNMPGRSKGERGFKEHVRFKRPRRQVSPFGAVILRFLDIDAFDEMGIAEPRIRAWMAQDSKCRPDIGRSAKRRPVQKGTRNPEHIVQLPQLRSLSRAKTRLWVTLTQQRRSFPQVQSNLQGSGHIRASTDSTYLSLSVVT